MNIELKNVKHAEFSSRETNCFSATIYVDGKRAGTVRNEGSGGPDCIEPMELSRRLNDYAKSLPLLDVSYMFSDSEKHEMEQTAETLIGDLLEKYLSDKILKRNCAKKTLAYLPGQTYKKGEYNVFNVKFSQEVKAKLVAKYGDKIEIINERFI